METRSVRPEFTNSEFRSLVHSPSPLPRQDFTYCKHFGFVEPPFSVTSDPHFFYSNAATEKILSGIASEIAQKGAFVALTGEPGTGKTTLLRKLIGDSADRVDYIFIGVNARMSFIGLLQEILKEAGVLGISTDRQTLLEQFDDYLQERCAEDRRVVLVFDEAQAISDEALRELSLLCSSEGGGLMSILLAGQPGLQGRLAQLKPLKQRMALTKRLIPLKRDDIASYIALRLRQVGYQGEELFEQQAIEKIVDASDGIPRVINSICDCALLLAYRASEDKITAKIIDQVAYELRLGGRSPSMDQRAAAAMIQVRNLKRATLAPLVEAEEMGGSLEHEESGVQQLSVEWSTSIDERASEELAPLQNLEGAVPAPLVEAEEMGDSLEHEEIEVPQPPVEQSISMNQRTFEEPTQLQSLARTVLAPLVKVRGMLAHPEQEKKELQPTLPVEPSMSMRQKIAADLVQRWNRERVFVGPQVKIRLTEAGHKLKQFGEQLVQFSSVNRSRLTIGALMIIVASAWSYIMLHPFPKQRDITGLVVVQSEKNPPQKAALVRIPETALINNKTVAKKPGQLVPISIPSVAASKKSEPPKEANSEQPKELAGAKKRPDSPAVTKVESPASEELYRVSSASFVRDKPTDNAEIIDTLRPGVRVAILNKSGQYYRVRSLGERIVSGFVHKEDAFFERIQ